MTKRDYYYSDDCSSEYSSDDCSSEYSSDDCSKKKIKISEKMLLLLLS